MYRGVERTTLASDVIHVLVEGRVVESGSHQELIAAGGRYAESWRRQMRTGVVRG